MQEDYESSAIRHYKDAVLLEQEGHLDNAGHLVGFAAECAIKLRIAALRAPPSAPHSHLPHLLVAARKCFKQRDAYSAMYQLLKNSLLDGWEVNRRYEQSGSLSKIDLDRWFKDTRRLLGSAGIKMK